VSALAAVRASKRQTIELERYEAKYLVPPSLVPAIREFIAPFCEPDEHAPGTLPEYTITTLQLDTPDLALYYAKEYEALARFKLRIRTYGLDRRVPVFVEIKRKIKGVIVKSRATIPGEHWGPDLITHPGRWVPFRSQREAMNYLNFVRLVRELGARPVVLIRYDREAYLGRNDRYARLTFDRRLRYCPTRGWNLWTDERYFYKLDSSMVFGRAYSPVILELKTFSDAPQWMVELTERFDLQRIGFSKYFAAMRVESLYRGAMYSDASENCTWW
jgi:hypothetical protein